MEGDKRFSFIIKKSPSHLGDDLVIYDSEKEKEVVSLIPNSVSKEQIIDIIEKMINQLI